MDPGSLGGGGEFFSTSSWMSASGESNSGEFLLAATVCSSVFMACSSPPHSFLDANQRIFFLAESIIRLPATLLPRLEESPVDWIESPDSGVWSRLFGIGLVLRSADGSPCLLRMEDVRLILLAAPLLLALPSSGLSIVSGTTGGES